MMQRYNSPRLRLVQLGIQLGSWYCDCQFLKHDFWRRSTYVPLTTVDGQAVDVNVTVRLLVQPMCTGALVTVVV
jgi:hypothetical protein